MTPSPGYSITEIKGEVVNDSRGNPTLKVTIYSGRQEASFSVPSGASTGMYEAYELRDEDKIGVNTAVRNVNDVIAKKLVGMDILNQKEIDSTLIKLDGSRNK